MFRFDVRRAVGVVAVAFSLVLAGPAEAAGRLQGRAPIRNQSNMSQAPGAWQTFVLALGQAGTVSPFARLVSTWLEEGHLIDPNGLYTVPSPTPIPLPSPDPGSNSSSSSDEGHLIDPNG